MYDVIIVGGSYAGMSAGLQLARARRRVLVVDAGKRRNRFAASAHGFLGSDGRTPDAIAAAGKADLLAYPTVTWREGSVDELRAEGSGFVARVGGDRIEARRVVLASGIVDELPSIPGIADRWGRTVFHCPYCHGYELDQGRLGVLASNPLAMHQAPLVAEWGRPGETTLFLNGAFEPDAEQTAELRAHDVHVEKGRVVALGGDGPAIDVHLEDGRIVHLDGLFVMPRVRFERRLAESLGCALEEGPTGAFIATDAMKETTVPGVFACGDVARPFGSVAFAVADGVMAGTAAHRSLVFRR